ncbi:DegT/DnrJ/EryC1/StrS family aminotransferase [Streptococcus constellatus]|uniref:DegT/DnrJ/EryC1/StrS family aminotransferase n=1 Tax=Streptococcus constellatus TaxID=76860 RepID=UPI000660EB80|nr:DegT/DnrJ/EryC1/StrS family aminotransferase [Streptococcus constellatus]
MRKLAIFGGEPAFPTPLNFIKPMFPEYFKTKYESYFNNVFETGILSKGKYLEEYESEVKKFLEVPFASAVSSGTIGLILAMEALGIKSGDEVLVPSFTFCATVHAIKKVGATPVFIDCNSDTFTIQTSNIEKYINDKTKAIIAVHIFGVGAEVYELERLANSHNLRIIYDAAHAFGSTIDNKHLGTFGDISVYSTSPTKTLVTGEGGIVVCKDKEIDCKIRLLREYGNPGDYNCTEIGINARLSELAAITGLMSLSVVNKNLSERSRIGTYYRKLLSEIEGISLQKIPNNQVSTFKDLCIVVHEDVFGLDRDTIVDCLNKEGIPTRNYFFPPVHKMACYPEYSDVFLENTERISNNIICLPMHPFLTFEDIEMIIDVLKTMYFNAEEIKKQATK